ncbi:MAG: antibiotic biosynthesis monooxygenase [Candidatus Sumerlaeaceae bacterium]
MYSTHQLSESLRQEELRVHIVHVFVHVKPECVQSFIEATLDNARNSVAEPGVARFDVIQELEDLTRFVLVEVYRDEAAAAAHKHTAHYLRWRDTVAAMMADPRTSIKFRNIFPGEDGWDSV